MFAYLYIFIHRSGPIGFLLQGIVLPSNPYRNPTLRKLKRYGEGEELRPVMYYSYVNRM